MGKQLLYLDFDGVLHPNEVYRQRGGVMLLPQHHRSAGHRLFEHAGLLDSMLEPYPAVRIVLSTSWVRCLGFSVARSYLPPTLAARVVGATYHSAMRYTMEFEHMSRGQQVLADVQRRLPRAWLAIDDDGEAWPNQHLDKLVLSHPDKGISEHQVQNFLAESLEQVFGRNA